MRTAVVITLTLALLGLTLEAAATPRLEPCWRADWPVLCPAGEPAWQLASHQQRGGGRDQDRARDAYRSGDVLPLSRILSGVRSQYPGKLLDANLAPRGGGYVYIIKLLDSGNRVRVIQVDAQTGAVLSVR